MRRTLLPILSILTHSLPPVSFTYPLSALEGVRWIHLKFVMLPLKNALKFYFYGFDKCIVQSSGDDV